MAPSSDQATSNEPRAPLRAAGTIRKNTGNVVGGAVGDIARRAYHAVEDAAEVLGDAVDIAVDTAGEAAEALCDVAEDAAHALQDVAEGALDLFHLGAGNQSGGQLAYPHENYATTCLFVRKLQTGVHYERLVVSGKRKQVTKKATVIYLGHGSSSLDFHGGTWSEGASGALGHCHHRFSDLLSIESLDPHQMGLVLPTGAGSAAGSAPSPSRILVLTFRAPKHVVARSGHGKGAVAPSPDAADDASAGPVTMLRLWSASLDDIEFLAEGLELLKLHWKHHARTEKELLRGKPGDQHAGKKKGRSVLSHVLAPLHLLYRPHHHHNRAPERWHSGIVVEVAFSDSYNLRFIGAAEVPAAAKAVASGVPDEKAAGRKVKTPNALFGDGSWVRASVKCFDGTSNLYTLEYRDGPYACDEEPTGEVKLNMGTEGSFWLTGVRPRWISVDMDDNFISSPPYFLLMVSAIQVTASILSLTRSQGYPLHHFPGLLLHLLRRCDERRCCGRHHPSGRPRGAVDARCRPLPRLRRQAVADLAAGVVPASARGLPAHRLQHSHAASLRPPPQYGAR